MTLAYFYYLGDESFQSFTCTGTDNLTTKRQNTQITQNNTTQKWDPI